MSLQTLYHHRNVVTHFIRCLYVYRGDIIVDEISSCCISFDENLYGYCVVVHVGISNCQIVFSSSNFEWKKFFFHVVRVYISFVSADNKTESNGKILHCCINFSISLCIKASRLFEKKKAFAIYSCTIIHSCTKALT